MVKTLVVVGAGPGLGMGVARAFGLQGFQVGLIARTKGKLDTLVSELAELGITAAAFPADIRDRDALTTALTAARDMLGPIDVLEYSPSPTGPITHAAQTTVDSAAAQFELHVLGAVTAVGQVLPEMLARGEGTLLLTTGVSSTVPAPFLANVGMAMAGLRNWAHTLHAELKSQGIYAGTVTIASGVVPGGGEADPDAIGARYYSMYQQRNRVEEVIGDLDAFRSLVAQTGRRGSSAIPISPAD
ncbi:SDR family NAD(P)-dependent oxidoreductase [Streptomyces sp. NBC_00385]|uniref:SDR family NAD(P)-dependent oxidoreductase n=1 Tax=Streptomyces sp. NBC_00385 TaxID=2975733 RepID=UPI002DD8BA1D|nr:SDR family NAD(P)-dependent oxidoreductase [Streptomyces sp. NBC_00385]WRZ03034.1 SDR family NAD(P)-dependent oxidoreductase [Streptomyces sp. NBC_00385]